eukprot:CAMPEP_0178378274 /NCGR_PEP_ID=MMETSP0689_2-20121128/4344_1 /TAXON_ID=160604 /ORGANISM="Amphidinium massartii, Strain CS-259" /LENGTH=89 /DNA_ID=CAMNT_0019998343 /DNA_START=284 /DNA_END=553 /DNA_ORIENTATION=-
MCCMFDSTTSLSSVRTTFDLPPGACLSAILPAILAAHKAGKPQPAPNSKIQPEDSTTGSMSSSARSLKASARTRAPLQTRPPVPPTASG